MAVRPQVFETCASTGSAICPDLKAYICCAWAYAEHAMPVFILQNSLVTVKIFNTGAPRQPYHKEIYKYKTGSA